MTSTSHPSRRKAGYSLSIRLSHVFSLHLCSTLLRITTLSSEKTLSKTTKRLKWRLANTTLTTMVTLSKTTASSPRSCREALTTPTSTQTTSESSDKTSLLLEVPQAQSSQRSLDLCCSQILLNMMRQRLYLKASTNLMTNHIKHGPIQSKMEQRPCLCKTNRSNSWTISNETRCDLLSIKQ